MSQQPPSLRPHPRAAKAPAVEEVALARQPLSFRRFSSRCILLAGHLSFGILESYQKTLLAIATASLTELILGRIFLGKWPHLASAYITGISVGILLRSPAFWPYAVWRRSRHHIEICAALQGPPSLEPLQFRHLRHAFPAACAPWPCSAFSGATTCGRMVVIWVLGSVIIWRLRRFHISATYVVSFLVLAVHPRLDHPRARGSQRSRPLPGPEYQLFIFFMITDPKTTVRSKRANAS